MHEAESAMTSNMSADTRRQIIDHIVDVHTGLNNPNWWGPLDDPANVPIAYRKWATVYPIAYREWATAAAPILRTGLEALPDSELVAEKERCTQHPAWLDFSSALHEELERQEELERCQKYHRNIAQRGGRAHRSTGQPPEIIEACKDMYATNPSIKAREAYDRLKAKTGHRMPDGRVVRFEEAIRFEPFRTKYWPKRKR
jgi:hypothetical protein